MNSETIPAETPSLDLTPKKSPRKWFTYLVPVATLLGLALLGSYFYISGNTQALAQVPAEKSTAWVIKTINRFNTFISKKSCKKVAKRSTGFTAIFSYSSST